METKKKTLPAVVILKEGLCSLAVCSTVPPERAKEELANLVHLSIGRPGTFKNEWELADEEYPPVQCSEYEGCWHYVLIC